MPINNKHYRIAGILLSLAGVIGALTLDEAKYSTIALLGVVLLILSTRQKKE